MPLAVTAGHAKIFGDVCNLYCHCRYSPLRNECILALVAYSLCVGISCQCVTHCVACSACVSMGERNRCMGASAMQQLVTNTKNTIWGYKKLIGRKFKECVVQNEIPHFTYEVIESKDGGIGIQVRWRKLY